MKHRKIVQIVEDEFILSLLYDNFLRELGFDTEGHSIDGNTAVATEKKD
ncbi:MAG: hypothetical protein ACNS64_05800 [Candidatus Halalkalibacterium sp. M3_1C_030]